MTDTHFESFPSFRQPSNEPGETAPASPLELTITSLEEFAVRLPGYREGDNIVYAPPARTESTGAGSVPAGNIFTVNLGVRGHPDRVVFIEAITGTGREMGTLPLGEGEAGHWRIGDNGVAVSDKAGPGRPGVEPEPWAQAQLTAFKECADDPLRQAFFHVEQALDTDAAA